MICSTATASSAPRTRSTLFFTTPENKPPINVLHQNSPYISCKSLKLSSSASASASSPCLELKRVLHKSLVPLAASLAILLSPTPAKAGFLSGFSGIESVPGPQLPEIDFLNRFNEENQKKYAENDERFKSSPLLKKLLERSKQNKEKNKQEIQNKYCIRGAEWGVGDCSTDAMSPEEKENFIALLKEKAGVK